ncbi:transporter substrate-binding domain-containing protein [uncultured Marinobacter sp.]|uniref:substrate-binding periplasmic protein n=1 Tax=uncultured Marinobacter sp. TaxID=187379 RepID=UPI0025D022F8|nr:transporter substrate-binding domain-containing protein [uncultured Marinobacter sp.]
MSAQAHIRRLLALLAAAIMLATTPVQANETEITVGVYHFPPIASVDDKGAATGLLGDLLQELEQAHPSVSFRVFHTSPKRRYLDFDAGLYDVIFFESPDWGWTDKEVDISRPILADEELYVALRKPGRDTSFFDDLQSRSIVAISGYHYGFTGYETDNSLLEQKFDIEFSDSHIRNINLIKADRPSVAEVAIVSYSYLQRHLDRHPEDWNKLLISDNPDQRYQLSIVARKGGAASADEMLRLLAPLVDNGRYRQLVEHWGLKLPAGFLTSFEAP